jgi:hypothetical protein
MRLTRVRMARMDMSLMSHMNVPMASARRSEDGKECGGDNSRDQRGQVDLVHVIPIPRPCGTSDPISSYPA